MGYDIYVFNITLYHLILMFFSYDYSFSHTIAVTRTAKVSASVALVLINLFFVYFTILRAADKGNSWQWSFVVACVFQLLVEVFLYETLECYWVSRAARYMCVYIVVVSSS